MAKGKLRPQRIANRAIRGAGGKRIPFRKNTFSAAGAVRKLAKKK